MPQLRAPDGQIVSVPDDQASQLIAGGYTPVSVTEAGQVTAAPEREDSGVLAPVGALASSFLSGASLGLSDIAFKGLFDKGNYERLATDRAEHPVISGTGQLLGAIAGGPTPAGALSKATGALAEGGGGLATKLVAGGLEGSVFNAGAYLSDSALEDRELSAEGLRAALGAGFEFGAGGSVAALGIEHGTIAARRLFSRLADGTDRAATTAEQAWQAKYQATIEAHDAAADIARAKLAEAQLARQQAQAIRDRAAADLAEARAGTAPSPPEAAGAAPPVTSTAAAPTPEPLHPDVQIASMLRDRAMAAAQPEALAAWDAEHGSKLQALMTARQTAGGIPPGLAELAAKLPETAASREGVLSQAAEAELAAALSEHDAARVDLDDLLRKIEAPEVGEPGGAVGQWAVPPAEFGAPGERGIKLGEELAPKPPTGVQAATGDITAVGKRRQVADGTPVEAQAIAPETPPTQFSKTRGGQAPRSSPLSDDEFNAFSKSAHNELHPEEHAALNQYSNNGMFGVVNSNLRRFADTPDLLGHPAFKGDPLAFLDHGSGIPGLGKTAQTLDDAISASKAPRDMVVYRGLNGTAGEGKADLWALKPGDSFVDHGFASTSNDLEAVGKGYTHGFGVRPGVELHIEVPAGHPIAPVPSVFAKEKELLLPRGSKFTVESTEKAADGHLVMRVRVGERLPAEAASALPEVAVAPESDLLAQLKGTAAKLGEGEGLGKMGAPARAGYRAAKEVHTAEAAQHFRGQALAARAERAGLGDAAAPWNEGIPMGRGGGGYEASPMAAMEREAQAAARRQLGEPTGHPLSAKRLEMAHDAAVERAATATDPAERAAATADAEAISKQLTAVGKRPGAVEDVAAAAPVVTRYERAAAKLTEALGEAAPPAAKEAAQAFRAAEDAAERKTLDRTTRALDDHAASQPAASDEQWFGPSKREQRVAAAKASKLQADAAFARARAAETEARTGATAAKRTAAETRKAAEAARPGPPEPAPPSRLGAVLTTVAAAGELGVPGIPHPRDIPVIGPLLSLWTKYRIAKAMVGRFPGRVAATGDARAAALVARAKDKVATAVDRTLGLVGAVASKRQPIAIAATVLGHRLIDDGEPDAPKGANVQQIAAVRIREISAATTRPDLVSAMVRAKMGNVTDPDLIAAAEQVLMQQFKYLASVAPKAPPPNPFSKTEWVPSPGAAADLAQRIGVLHDPETAFRTPTVATADALANFYPKLFAFAQQRLMERAADLQHPMPYQQQLTASLIFRVPVAVALEPGRLAILQSAHVALRESMGPAPEAPSAPPTPSLAAPTNLNQMYETSADRRAARSN